MNGCPIFMNDAGYIVACKLPPDHPGLCIGEFSGGKGYAITTLVIPPEMRAEFARVFLYPQPKPFPAPRDRYEGVKELFEAWWDAMTRGPVADEVDGS